MSEFELTPDQLLHANELCRRHVGKALEDCSAHEVRRVRIACEDELECLLIQQATVLHEVERIIDE